MPGEVTAQPGEAKLAWAIYLASLGLAVFPLVENAKTPLAEGWQAMASSDPAAIRQMWVERTAIDPATGAVVDRVMPWNIGIATTGLVVFDIDTKKDPNALAQYENELLGDHDTFEVETPSGGRHIYYRNPGRDCKTIANIQGLAIDIRAEGGLVVAPGSTVDGKSYRIVNPAPIRPLPPHLRRVAPAVNRKQPAAVAVSLSEADESAAIATAIRMAATAPGVQQGGRGTFCRVNLALRMRDLGISDPEVIKKIIAENWAGRCDPPLPFDDERGADGQIVQGVSTEVEHAFLHAQNPIGSKSARATLGNVVISSPPPVTMMATGGAPAGMLLDHDAAGLPGAIAARTTIGLTVELTETGCATGFLHRYSGLFCYDHTAKSWFYFDGAVWRKDEVALAFFLMHRICLDAAYSGEAKPGDVNRLTRANFVTSSLKLAQADPSVAATSAIWDRDPMLMATPGGTIDLRTGALRAADPADYMTQTTAAAPAETADCPIWLQFFNMTLGGDEELIGFLQRWFGYALTGDIREQCLVFIFGDGGNGKGVVLHTIAAIMASYHRTAPMETLMASPTDRHSTDLNFLRGARLVTASETQKDRNFDEQRIKALTGGDEITSRGMRENNSSWMPILKLTIAGNAKPGLRTVSDAERRRFNLMRFGFKPERPDPELEMKLRREWPAILRWAIDGTLAWQRHGLQRPQAVLAETELYFQEQDTFGLWAAERLIRDPDASVQPSALLDSFNEWARRQGETTVSAKVLKAAWTDRQKGLRYVARNGQNFIKGIKLRPPGFQDVAGPNLPPPPPPAKEAE